MTAKTMTEVLAEHQQKVGVRDMRSHCWCGWAGEPTGIAFIAHQSAALSAAGFGLVADAKAGAWAEGYDRGTDLAAWAIGNRPQSERPDTDNPYRATL